MTLPRPVGFNISSSWTVLQKYKEFRLEQLTGLPFTGISFVSRFKNYYYRIVQKIGENPAEDLIHAESDDLEEMNGLWDRVYSRLDGTNDKCLLRRYGAWSGDSLSPAIRVKGRAKSICDFPQQAGSCIEVLYGTNRVPEGLNSPNKYYSNAQDTELHCGICQVFVPASHQYGRLESNSLFVRLGVQADNTALRTVYFSEFDNYGFSAQLRWIFENTSRKDILCFVHGYNVKFDSAVRRSAQIGFDIRWAGVNAVFSWPSAGTVDGYATDGERVVSSVEHFVEYFKRLITHLPAGGKIHILSHSIGNKLTTLALQKKALRNCPNIGHLIFAAPDVGEIDFTTRISQFINRKVSGALHAYICTDDKALRASQLLQQPRFGNTRSLQSIPSMTIIEILNVKHYGYFGLHHSYVYELYEVLEDLSELLRSRPAHSRSSLTSKTSLPDGLYSLDVKNCSKCPKKLT